MSRRTKHQSDEEKQALEEQYYFASQWQLMGRKLKKHKLAIVGMVVLFVLYFIAIFCEFLAPYGLNDRRTDYIYAPPQRLHWFDQGKFHLRPFVYGVSRYQDPETLLRTYGEDKSIRYPLRFFVHGDEYEFWGLFKSDIHLFGVEDDGVIFLFGTDRLSRDMLSRVMYGTRISLSVGLVGVCLTLVLGLLLGGISGYFGGMADTLIQRVIEVLRSFPVIPLWLALSAAIPVTWPVLRVYFVITVILALIGWTGLARVVRGKILSLREEDYIMAARLAGCTDMRIIGRHLLPGFMSYIIVNITLSIPFMILGETSLSFLGVGLRPPITSWGVLLVEAQNVRTLAFYPWLLIPALFVIVTVLAFNFLGDGLRDAADPYR